MKKAFTLAEVLIAMTIVGIVSVLTVPSVMQNTFTKTNVAKLQAVYAQVSQAVKQAMIDERITDLRDSEYAGCSDDYDCNKAFVEKYFNVSKVSDNFDDCFATSYKDLNGTTDDYGGNWDISGEGNAYAILTNGAAISFDISRQFSGGSRAVFSVDVNGQESPNILGRDVFSFFIYNNGFVGVKADTWSFDDEQDPTTELKNECKTLGGSYGEAACFMLLQQNNWKADY